MSSVWDLFCGVESSDDSARSELTVQVCPNPIRDSGLIRYMAPVSAKGIMIEILDVSGRRLQWWWQSDQNAGASMLEWNGTDQSGYPLPMGTYFYRAYSGEHLISGKFQVVR